MPQLIIKTAQMARAKKESDMLDITVKSGDKVFAPTWTMVMGYKYGKISEQQYYDAYHLMMEASYLQNTDRWIEVVSSGSITLACYCKAGDFCHRTLLAEMLKATAEYHGINVILEGEIV